MLVILAILAYFVLKIEDIGLGGATTRKITVVFDSAAGLNKKTDVRMAGVPVGKIEDISLQKDGKARVTLDVDERVPLHENASARVANLGLLGEKYVELDSGTLTTPLRSGDITLHGTQPASIDEVTNQMSDIAKDVKAITESLRNTVVGQTGQQRLEDIVENVRTITVQVRELIAANRTNVDATMANMRAITADLRVEIPKIAASIDRVASSVGGTVGENREDVRMIVENLRRLSADLRTTTENLNSITGQVKSGEGTVGRLIYSGEAHDKLSAALTSVESGVNELKNTLGRANRITMDLGIKADYYAGLKEDPNLQNIGGTSRSAVTLQLVPNPQRNRFYNIELADDPRGHIKRKVLQEEVTDPVTGVTTTRITKETKFDRDFVISAQAGWLLNSTTVRLGLFDNTGGAGVDYRLNNRIRVTGEAFDFGNKRDNNPHLRLFGEYIVRTEKPRTPLIFVATGVDNVLNDTAFTFGGGIRWRDEDLKYLLGSIPIGK
jgi:phospholipid/cholesterol/gamma-HCH transport system substrate-binding protein